ncbi:MAG: ArsR/SmtB family transcription factor [Nitrososphaerales archaeon]
MEALEKLFNALANKNRLKILATLNERKPNGMTYTELKRELGFNPNTLSYNLGVLIDAKLVERLVMESEKGYTSYRITERGRSYLREASSY